MSLTSFDISHTRGVQAPVGKRQQITLEELCALAKRTKADHKVSLPMFMGGTFDNTGDRRNKNMRTITAVLGDCDTGGLTASQAYEAIKAHGLIGAIITTPSHKSDAPRWRAVFPLKGPIEAVNKASFDQHRMLACKLNTVFGLGVLGTEGTAASRPWYYGSLNGQPECETYVNNEGVHIDLSDAKPLPYPKSAGDKPPVTPKFAGDADAEAIGRAVLTAAATFENGHEGLRPAAMMIAPFVRIGAVGIEEAAAALQDQLEATSKRKNNVPPEEARRTLEWAMSSDNVSECVAHVEKALEDKRTTVTDAARKLGARYVDDSDAFGDVSEVMEAEEETRAEALLDALSLSAWVALDIPPRRRFLGSFLMEGSLAWIAGPTGLGKTQIAHAIAAGIASGDGFLHWKTDNPARVLVFDGEMSKGLVKERLRDIHHNKPIPPRNLVVYALDRADEFIQRFPELGKPSAINTKEGQDWCKRLIKLVRPNVVIFDNLMSWTIGDQTTEQPWSETSPLASWIRAQGIAQLWLDHTGLNRTRQYGSSTKQWRADAAAMLLDPPEGTAKGQFDIAFVMSFEAPAGKARERCKANWGDFAPHLIRCTEEGWSSERVDKEVALAAGKPGSNGTRDEWRNEGSSNELRVFAEYTLMREECANSPITDDDLAARCADILSKAKRPAERKRSAERVIQRLVDTGKLARDGRNLIPPRTGRGDEDIEALLR